MALTKEEMQDLIERNRLEKQATRAQDEMAVRNRAGERWLNREQAANAAAADRNAEARQRRIDRNRLIADGDRGRFSAFETRGLLGLKHTQFGDVRDDTITRQNALQQHELDMLRQEGKNKIGVAHENALGMRGQGAEAAEFGYKGVQDTNATKLSIAEKQESGLTERERNSLDAAQKLETIKGKNALGVANTTGEWTVKNTAEANKGLVAKNELERQRQEAEIATKIQTAMINAGAKIDAAKAAEHSRIIGAAIQGATTSGKDLQTALAELAEAKKNNPELLSSIKAYSGQQQQQPTSIPGYSPEKVAELQKRGYKWNGKQWTK